MCPYCSPVLNLKNIKVSFCIVTRFRKAQNMNVFQGTVTRVQHSYRFVVIFLPLTILVEVDTDLKLPIPPPLPPNEEEEKEVNPPPPISPKELKPNNR